MKSVYENINSKFLIDKFNNRDEDAFSTLYIKFIDELYHYASKHFPDTINIEDTIQDIFIAIWSNNIRKFDTLQHLRNFLYLSLRNKILDYIDHSKAANNYTNHILRDEDYHTSQIIESEVISVLNDAVSLLPEECAKVFKMYVEGWDTKEIADKLGKAPSTVYNQKNRAIQILKQKMSEDKLLIILKFFSVQ